MLLDASGYETGTGAGVTARFRFTLIESGRPLSKVFYRREDGVVDKIASAQLAEGYAREFAVGSLEELNALLNRLTGKQAAIWGVTGLTGQVKVVAEKYRGDGEITRTLKYFAWPAGPGFLMIDLDRPEQPEPDFYYPEREAAVAALRSLHPVFTEVPILWRPSASSGVEGEGIKGQRLYVPVRDARLISEAGGVLADLQWLKGWGRIELAKDGSPLTRGLIDTAPWQPNWLDFVGPPVLRDGIRRDPPPAFIDPGLLDSADLSPLLKLDTKALRREADALRDRAKQAKAREAVAVRTAYKRRTGRDYLPDDPLNAVQTLGPDHVLEDRHGDRITVGELLADPERWHGVQLRDPLEPDYRGGSLVAKAFLVNCQPLIVSYAHGKKRYRLHDPERDFAGLETVEEEDGREEGGEEEEDPAEAPVAAQLERMRTLRRAQAREGLELAARSLAERTRLFTSVQEALADPMAMTLNAGTGIGKTYALADVEAAAALLLIANAPPVLIICGTSTHNVDNFYKEVTAALERRLTARHLANGLDEDTAKTLAAEEAAELMQGCAKVQHNRAILPFRNREGHYTYRLILCTYAAVNRIGDAIDSRGRVLRLLAGMRSLEEKHGLESEPILIFGDEADAGLMNARVTILLQYRLLSVLDKETGNTDRQIAPRCQGKDCHKCVLQPKTYAAETKQKGISQLRISPWLWWRESAAELTLDWLPDVIGSKMVEDGNYEIYGIRVENLPDIDPTTTYTTEDGSERHRFNPEGQVIRWMRQPGATLRRLLPRDRRQDRLIPPRDIEPGADIQWPSYPCEAWSLVSWDREAFSDLATLCLSTPKLLSASFSAGTLAMVEHAFGPQEHGQIPTPEDRKMRHVHIAAIPDALSFAEDEVTRLLVHGPVLWVVQTKGQAERLFEIVKAWTSPQIKPAIYSEGALSQIEVFKHNLLITYPRSSLARGANLGHCRTIICHTDYYGALLHELGLGHEDMRVSLEEENQANLIQAIGRIMRQDENNPADDKCRMIILRSTTDRDGNLIEDGKFLIPRMQALALEVTYSQFNIHPRRVLDAQDEFFSSGQVTRDDTLDPETTADKLSPRQRRLTAESRATAKAAAREERAEAKRLEQEEAKRLAREAKETARREKTEARLWELAAAGVSWTDARRETHIARTHKTPEKVQELRQKFQEIALSS